MPQAVSAYMRERIDEFHKMVLEVIDSPDSLAEPWLTSLTHAPYTGWSPAPLLPIPEVTADQRFRVMPSLLRFIENQDKLLIRCDSGFLEFPVSLAPILKRLSSELESFTIPDVLSWQQMPEDSSANEIIPYLKTLYRSGILKRV
jgi:hypothetical protein